MNTNKKKEWKLIMHVIRPKEIRDNCQVTGTYVQSGVIYNEQNMF